MKVKILLMSLVLGLFVAFGSVWGADNFGMNGWSIDIPEGFVKADKENYDIVFESKDKKAMVGIIVKEVKKNTKTAKFLKAMEKEMGAENELDKADQKVKGKDLKQVGASEGSMGVYSVSYDEGATAVLIIGAFKKANKIFVVVVSIDASVSDTYMDKLEKSLETFKITM